MELGEGLGRVCREGLNVAVVKNESASGFWNFLDVKANAFPHFPHLNSKRSSHPTQGPLPQKLKYQNLADRAWHLSFHLSSCDGNTNGVNAWIKGGLYRGIVFPLSAAVDDILIFFFFFLLYFYSSTTSEKRNIQDRKVKLKKVAREALHGDTMALWHVFCHYVNHVLFLLLVVSSYYHDLVFLGIEMRGTIQPKNVVAVFLRRSNDTAQEKYAGSIEGDIYGDPKSKTANVEILLSPTKDEDTCAPKVRK
jgi:hypothetical protein